MTTSYQKRTPSALSFLLLISSLPYRTAAQNDTSLVFNPGPNYQCYDINLNDQCGNTSSSSYYDECALVPHDGTAPYPPTFTGGWSNTVLDGFGGFPGGGGCPITITLSNNALTPEEQVSCGQGCELNEVVFEYTYPGYAIKKLPNDESYNLAEYDQWIVEYDVTIHEDPDCEKCVEWETNCASSGQTYPGDCQVQESGCSGYTRRYLTTDFIYYWTDSSGTDYKNLISVIHYNPIHTIAGTGYFELGNGFRIAVNGPPGLVPGTTTHVALDFRALLEQYSNQLCHAGTVPANLWLYSLQIVSSNVNTTSTIDITNTNIILRNDPDPAITYPMPTVTYSSVPAYCP